MFGLNKRPIEKFIVSKSVTTMPVTGSLMNSATGNVNLADGQLGIVNPGLIGTTATWNFTDATPTITEAQSIAIVQGNENSASLALASAKHPLYVRPYEITHPISGIKKDIRVTKQAYAVGANELVQIGNIDANAGRLVAADNTNYQLRIDFEGRRHQEYYSYEQAASLTAQYLSPNFTTLGYSAVQARSSVLTGIAADINLNSHALGSLRGTDPVMAFALGEATGTGATAVAGLTVGQVIPVFRQNGQTFSVALTAEMLASLQAAVAANALLTHILIVDKSDIGTFARGLVKALWIMALDEREAYIDYVTPRKVYLRVSFFEGFQQTVTNTEIIKGNEGHGYGRSLDLLYRATEGQRKYFNQHNLDPVINFPSPFDLLGSYTVYNINYSQETSLGVSTVNSNPHRAIVCIPASNTTLIGTFDNTLNSWLSSTGNANIITL